MDYSSPLLIKSAYLYTISIFVLDGFIQDDNFHCLDFVHGKIKERNKGVLENGLVISNCSVFLTFYLFLFFFREPNRKLRQGSLS